MDALPDQDLPEDGSPSGTQPPARARTRVLRDGAKALTPGAGDGLGHVVGDELLRRSAFLDDLIAAFGDGLKATVRYWDKEAEADDGSLGKWILVPDFKVRLAAANSIMAHLVGEPVKRVIHQHFDAGSAGATAADQLANSPAAREAAQKLLDRARRTAPGIASAS